MQVAKKFDKMTLDKIKKSGLISLGGFLVAVIPLVVPELQETFADKPVIIALIASVGAWAVNSIKEWLRGESQL